MPLRAFVLAPKPASALPLALGDHAAISQEISVSSTLAVEDVGYRYRRGWRPYRYGYWGYRRPYYGYPYYYRPFYRPYLPAVLELLVVGGRSSIRGSAGPPPVLDGV
jgi:hypothetical protein